MSLVSSNHGTNHKRKFNLLQTKLSKQGTQQNQEEAQDNANRTRDAFRVLMSKSEKGASLPSTTVRFMQNISFAFSGKSHAMANLTVLQKGVETGNLPHISIFEGMMNRGEIRMSPSALKMFNFWYNPKIGGMKLLQYFLMLNDPETKRPNWRGFVDSQELSIIERQKFDHALFQRALSYVYQCVGNAGWQPNFGEETVQCSHGM